MPKYSKTSKNKLSTCHPDLQMLFNEVIKYRDCTIIVGYRDEYNQDKCYNEEKSKVEWPNSKHNKLPSEAVDVAPYFSTSPHIRWHDIETFYHFAGFVLGIAEMMGIKIRWGGNWDSDDEIDDQTFNDLPHFEVII